MNDRRPSGNEHRQIEEKSGEEAEGIHLLLLHKGLPILLELSLRIRDLPGVHVREPLGHDLQQPQLDLPGLRRNPLVLIPSSSRLSRPSIPKNFSRYRPYSRLTLPSRIVYLAPIVHTRHRM